MLARLDRALPGNGFVDHQPRRLIVPVHDVAIEEYLTSVELGVAGKRAVVGAAAGERQRVRGDVLGGQFVTHVCSEGGARAGIPATPVPVRRTRCWAGSYKAVG